MKKILYLSIAVILTLASCKKSGKASKSDWMISVTVDGVTHKAEGTVDNSYNGFYNNGQNYAYASSASSVIMFSLTDKSHSSYVSGDNFTFGIITSNLSSGLNYFQLSNTGNDISNKASGTDAPAFK